MFDDLKYICVCIHNTFVYAYIIHRCNVQMEERARKDVSDGVSWWCKQCKGRKSIRNRSFFSKSRLSLQQWILALFWWVRQYPVGDMAKEAKIEKTNACDVYLWFREVIIISIIPNSYF